MNKKRKNPRWLSFLNGAVLWLVVVAFGYGLFTVQYLHPGSVLTEKHMAYLNLTEVVMGILMILAFFGGLYQLWIALRESDN